MSKKPTLLILTVWSWLIVAITNMGVASYVIFDELSRPRSKLSDVTSFGVIVLVALIIMILAILVYRQKSTARLLLIGFGIITLNWHGFVAYFTKAMIKGLFGTHIPNFWDYTFLIATILLLLMALFGLIGLLTPSVRQYCKSNEIQ